MKPVLYGRFSPKSTQGWRISCNISTKAQGNFGSQGKIAGHPARGRAVIIIHAKQRHGTSFARLAILADRLASGLTLQEVSKRVAGAYFSATMCENPAFGRLGDLASAGFREAGQGRFGWPKDARAF